MPVTAVTVFATTSIYGSESFPPVLRGKTTAHRIAVGRSCIDLALVLHPLRHPLNSRHLRTRGHRKFSRPSAATRRQTLQKYFRVWFLPHLFKINNDLYALSAIRAYEEVVGMKSNRRSWMVRNRHGGQILGDHLKTGHLWSVQNRPLWMA